MAREQHIDIHNYPAMFRNAGLAVEHSDLSARNKELILTYRDVCLRQNLCGKVRLIRVLGALALMGRLIEKDFDTYTRKDVEGLVTRLLQADPQYSPETIATYKAILKKFLTWVVQPNEFPTKQPPAIVAWLTCHVRARDRRALQAKDFLTADEAQKLLQVCANARDKALISVLWESGARISEIGNRQIKDLTKHTHGYLLDVKGKTGARTPLLVGSAPYLSAWLAYHPFHSDPEAPLWVHLKRTDRPRHVRYQGLRQILRDLFAKAGVKKRPNPHGLRHARTTHLAGNGIMTEPQLKAYLGWSQTSHMLDRYAHLSTSDANNAILAENNLAPVKPRTTPLEVRPCPICQEQNPANAAYCVRCSNAFDPKNAYQAQARQDHTNDLVLKMARLLVEKGLLDDATAQIHEAGLGPALKALATSTPPDRP